MQLKTLSVALIALVALALIALFTSRERNESWLSASGSYLALDQEQTELFETKLAAWLKSFGFELAEDPGGVVAWAGPTSNEEIVRWYQGVYKHSPPFLLRVSRLDRRDSGGGCHEFHFANAWFVNGTRGQNAKSRALAEEFTQLFIEWLDAVPTSIQAPPRGQAPR